MSTPGIQAALQQMQGMAEQAARPPQSINALQPGERADAYGRTAAGSFGRELQTSIERIHQLQQAAKTQTEAFQAGEPGVELGQVMADKQKASVAFQMGLQVRNRLVSAYKDVMNMQV